MDLFLLRHGKAEASRSTSSGDNKHLTKKAIRKMEAAAEGLKRLKVDPELILASPLVRTKETAQIVAEVLKVENVRVSKHLGTGADLRALVEEINASFADIKRILLVGHEPGLCRLISVLASGETELRIAMKKGAICKLTVGELRLGRCASIDWLMDRKQLELIGK